jgi:hypothetical protein
VYFLVDLLFFPPYPRSPPSTVGSALCRWGNSERAAISPRGVAGVIANRATMSTRRQANAATPAQGRLFAKVSRDFCAHWPVREWLLNRTPLNGVDKRSLEESHSYVCSFRALDHAEREAGGHGTTFTPGEDDDDVHASDAELIVPHAAFGNFVLATVRPMKCLQITL